jgi:Zn-dependent peptidase ImmA (M78 family)
MSQAQVIAAASGAALQAHHLYAIPRDKRVDVFGVLRTAASEVFFRPLKKVCGAYLPGDDQAPAVLINSNLPLSRQRYTAAHEFGHLFLKHSTVSLDETVGVSLEERRHWSQEENIAETFAAFFLMPAALIETSLRELRLSNLDAQTIYLLALKMGSSYQATVNHLQTLKKLTFAEAAKLRKIQPKSIKKTLRPLAAGIHDVWMLDEHWNGQPLYPAVEDTIVLHLNEIPTSGYSWVWQNRSASLRVVRDGFADEPGEEIGGSRVRELILEVSPASGATKIDLQRRQPWDSTSEPSDHFSVDLFPQEIRKTGPLVLPRLTTA